MEAQVDVLPIIVAHESRYDQAVALEACLGFAEVSLDDGTLGDWGNHAKALSWGAQQPVTHVLLVEDDAELADGFWGSVLRAVQSAPDSPISFYVGTSRPRRRQLGIKLATEEADRQGSTWLEADDMLWGVCYVVPVADIPGILELGERWGGSAPSDQLVGTWYRSQGRAVLYTWPSVVDHLDGPPVIRGRDRNEPRKAWRVGRFEPRGEPVTIQR